MTNATYSGHPNILIYIELENSDIPLYENFQWSWHGKVAYNTTCKHIIVRQALSYDKYWGARKKLQYLIFSTAEGRGFVRSFLAKDDEDAMDQEAACTYA